MARGKKPAASSTWRHASGKGSVRHLSGNRRNPWQVRAPAKLIYDEKTNNSNWVRESIGYYATKDEAEYALMKYMNGDLQLRSKYTFSQLYEMWKEERDSGSSSNDRAIKSAYNHSKVLHQRNFSELTISDLENAINTCEGSYAVKGRMKSLFNQMYDYAVKREIVSINKARQFSMGSKINELKKDEAKDRIPFAKEHIEKLLTMDNVKWVPMVIIGLYTGLRPQEICLILRDNVYLDDNYLIAGMKTESGTNRVVPIHPRIKDYIKNYYNLSEGHKYLIKAEITAKGDEYMTYNKYRYHFKQIMEAINASGLYTPHCTRHTFITLAKESDVDEYALKRIVGHSINDITESVYTHRDYNFLYNEILKIH